MDRDDLLKVLSLVGADYLRHHLKQSSHGTFEQWWPELVRDSPERSLLKRHVISMIYGLWRAHLESDLWGCYEHLSTTGSSLEDIPWPVIETALEHYITAWRRQRAHG
jgi:hypothetical protein